MFSCQTKTEQDQKEITYPYSFTATSNPWAKHIRTADPDARVWKDGRLWVYTSQDQYPDSSRVTRAWHVYNQMDGYHAFSTENLVDWVDHGEILHSKDVPWGIEEGGYMWAPTAAYKNGMYYLYFPHMTEERIFRTGVAISKNPQGPFVAEPNYIKDAGGDPMCFIDDDGQAYLYFGRVKVAKLSEDMLTLAEEPRVIDYGADNFLEGVYMHKRNGKYYFSYTNHKDSVYQGYYSIGDNPYGPFEYKGPVNPKPPNAQDHHSIVEYKGKWYYFYHVGNYTNARGEEGLGWMRNVCVDKLEYNEDGTMKMVQQIKEAFFKEVKGELHP